MQISPELKQRIQLVLIVALLVSGTRLAFVLYQRHESAMEQAKKQAPPLDPDYYVTPKKLHPYDLKSAHQLTEQPVWVKFGYQLTYYPYDRERRKTDFVHEAGMLLPLQKLAIQDVVTDVSPRAPENRQVLAVFSLDGKGYAVPIGAQKGSEFKIYSDEIFFIQDPHELYKHWSADAWQKIVAHDVQAGM